MIGALWTGISGLSSQQTALDNESNNIANVNTIGYKSSRISFADQMYQDRIGKGSKILDAEKLYVQGNLKLTGVNYDMALSGDGFFTVKNTTQGGNAESFYTRAGNFRMGDNGTLQDSAGNEVQGWAMRTLDPSADVISTNPNAIMFSGDYSELLGTRIVRHDTYVETITAKATDYETTARADASDVFSGTGLKSKAAKLNDIEELKKDYIQKLQDLKNNPDGPSATSIAQKSQIDFGGTVFKGEGDQISVTIDGTKISQKFVSTTATDEFKAAVNTGNTTTAGTATTIDTAVAGQTYIIEVDGTEYSYTATGADTTNSIATALDGLITADGHTTTTAGNSVDVTSATDVSSGSYPSDIASDFNLAASRIATYKSLADKISSQVPGVVAYNIIDQDGDAQFEDDDVFNMTTTNADVLKGMIEIKSLIPGKDFIINSVQETSNETEVSGEINETLSRTRAQAGTGIGAVQSIQDALSRAITGTQRNVYSTEDLDFGQTHNLGFSIYDKELKRNFEIPDAATGSTPINMSAGLDAAVSDLNNDPTFGKYLVAENINGNLVISTKDSYYDVEFSTTITATSGPNSGEVIDKNADYSGRMGAGAEFLQITNTIEQTSTQSSLQLKLDALGLSDSAFGEFNVDSTGLITMKQDGVDFAIGQVSVALFNNTRGLLPSGDNLLAKTNESGDPIYNVNNEKTAKIEGKTLELSTADLSESLVNLMVFQRAFEANAKSITTSDQLLNTLINLKR
ncbi:flagellar biosynthesis protein FlgE [Malaciobacter halophilus]|uniref:Flagellar biosynthesis protein FlgE n=1 Tax=Malaciobacter halophilus TaxID=197482 RepID=A0A2N1IZT3_9BACT|nr:flagellar hook-basal body complex protein [Malaciobacter halophilus]AXH10490.1 flagellar hook protein, epsilonproteobacterial variant [Malaciobacter halophilus]PKI79810.1 flagellar biosynthesis protein FlgE [Malaciobacter halophilus]